MMKMIGPTKKLRLSVGAQGWVSALQVGQTTHMWMMIQVFTLPNLLAVSPTDSTIKELMMKD
jgi:hypothetical protein